LTIRTSLSNDPSSEVSFEVAHETRSGGGGPVPDGAQIGDRPGFRFLLGRRRNDAPYFSQDAALVRTLAEVFASALENVHLQQRRLEEEQRTRELSLHASRSELKALRAQINPHFLFNALNAIAGHIHRDPARADRTVEQLADVFRYALRGAENEWTVLQDELDFIRAYLDVERARFGDRLGSTFDVTPEAARLRVPTMMLQTLVENAVKHGISTVRGRAVVGIRARVEEGRAVVSVSDNGAGFRADGADASSRRSGGYGLVNVRERLEGYFGAAAELSIDRDDARGLTVVSISFPLRTVEPLPAGGGTR
jgi:two-component system LytT family sensor kinase